jgi:hypothetical protein
MRTVAWVWLLVAAVGCEARKSPESSELKRARASCADAGVGAVVVLSVVAGAALGVANLNVEARRSGAAKMKGELALNKKTKIK